MADPFRIEFVMGVCPACRAIVVYPTGGPCVECRLKRVEADRAVLLDAVQQGIGFAVAFREDHPDAVEKFGDVGRLYGVLSVARDKAEAP